VAIDVTQVKRKNYLILHEWVQLVIELSRQDITAIRCFLLLSHLWIFFRLHLKSACIKTSLFT